MYIRIRLVPVTDYVLEVLTHFRFKKHIEVLYPQKVSNLIFHFKDTHYSRHHVNTRSVNRTRHVYLGHPMTKQSRFFLINGCPTECNRISQYYQSPAGSRVLKLNTIPPHYPNK